MKKIITSLLFIVGFTFMLFAQEDNADVIKSRHQFGLNIGPLVKTLVNKDFLNINREAFTYRYIKNDIALRFAIGGSFQKDISKDDNSNFNLNADVSVLTLKWGYDKRRKINKRWLYYYGFDLKYNAVSLEIVNQFTDVEEAKFNAFSLNPLLGFQLRLTPHLFLQTEASLSVFYQTSNNTSPLPLSDPIQIGQIFSSKSNNKGVELVLPNILFLVVEF